MAASARSQTNDKSPGDRRKTVEAFGRMFIRLAPVEG
jgi:hypothetical protein